MLTPAASKAPFHDTLHALAAGDFTQIAQRLSQGGLRTALPASGMLHLQSPVPATMRLLISVGVHGNETAPIEMMAAVLDSLAQAPQSLAVDLLLVVGNPSAVADGSRFIDADLNRLFTVRRGALQDAAEAARADIIMQASAVFFGGEAGQKWHLDLHSAIRPSRYARFAVVPAQADDASQNPMIAWLGSAGIDAVLFNSQRASTYSAFTAREAGAFACTVELGQVGVLGDNPADQLQQTQAAVLRLLSGQAAATGIAGGMMPARFRVAQELIKRSDDFHMTIDGAAHNFTAFAPHAVIATDGETTIRVGPITEYVVFPNPKVLVGQRAGLMVVRDDGSPPDAARADQQ
jgi:succinylglutamate desuccinylase